MSGTEEEVSGLPNDFMSKHIDDWNSAYVRWIAIEVFLSVCAILAVYIAEFVLKRSILTPRLELAKKRPAIPPSSNEEDSVHEGKESSKVITSC